MASVARVVTLAVVVAVAVAGIAGAWPGTVGATASGDQAGPPDAIAGTQVEADSVYLRASVGPDGTAAWTFEYRVLLDDQNTTDAFESLREDVEANASAFTDRFGDRIGGTVASAENATGREMAVRNVTVSASRQDFGREYGVVTYRFEWVGFAAVDGSRVLVGDALSGFFLDADTVLTITWPDGYRATEVRPEPDDRRADTAVWEGSLTFGEDEPRLVLEPAPGTTAAGPSPAAGTTATGTGGGGPPGGDGDGGGGDGGLDAGTALVALVVLLAVGGGLLLARRRGLIGGAESDQGPDETPAETGSAGADREPPPELLSNEERVVRLLRQRGGRMKQKELAEELGWTDAKTSQVVGDLRDEGTIEGFRLGRENVLKLPDEDDEIDI